MSPVPGWGHGSPPTLLLQKQTQHRTSPPPASLPPSTLPAGPTRKEERGGGKKKNKRREKPESQSLATPLSPSPTARHKHQQTQSIPLSSGRKEKLPGSPGSNFTTECTRIPAGLLGEKGRGPGVDILVSLDFIHCTDFFFFIFYFFFNAPCSSLSKRRCKTYSHPSFREATRAGHSIYRYFLYFFFRV